VKTAIRKQPWSNRTRQGILKGKPLNPSAAIEQRYYTALRVLIERMIADTEHELHKLFKTDHAEEYFAQDASISAQARILTNALIKKYCDLFASLSKPMADRFAGESDKSSDLAVKSSLRQLSDSLTLSTRTITSGPLADILSATITENVALIKSIPVQYLSGVQQAVMRSITTGNGMQDLVPFLQKHKGITLRRARMISQDQTKKLFSGLSKARMEKANIREYEWLHTSGSRHPRKLHISMNGKVYKYADPPIIDEKTGERGIPGQAINCACRMRPILKFSED
jgi:SPP1 gp7 family putative phage head morphogenesis protein